MKIKERFQGPLPSSRTARWKLVKAKDPVMMQLFYDELEKLDEELKPLTDALEASTQLTAADYSIYIGPIPD